MADNKITREVYKQYANKIVSVLNKEDFYEQFKKRVDKGASSFKLAKKRLVQDISIDWIDTIESILPNLDTIVRNPRKFIVQEEDIVDVSLARSISTESVKYLAQHTNMISKVDEKTGDVTPSKILNITKEESFEIYENRFIYTLLLKLKDFVTMRYDKIKKASATQDVLELDIESRFNLPSKKITYRTEYFAQLSFDEVMRLDPDTLTKIERVAKIDRIITDFLSSSFAKSMRNSAPVRPPIMRTNVILKEPNFKKALTLWQFVETYQQTAGFSTSDEVEDYEIDAESAQRLNSMITLNTMVFESLYDQCETDMDMEDKQFADFLRVGQMDFEKDKIDRDEYAQKLEAKKENEEEKDNIEEVKPQEDAESEKEIPPETPPEEQEPEQEENQPETPPEIEEKEIEKEVEKPQEIEKEVVVEHPVEVERFKEMPPKADQEEVDLEPDAEKFDQHLFEVRKIFKRPDDDKIKQEEIIKARDAIDRCLTSYRRIKQEELDERDRQERIRRRREDIQKRAEAFRKQREELEKNMDSSNDSAYFGMDPFSFQKAKIQEKKRLEEEAKRKEAIKFDKHENLELEDKNTDAINKSIDEMEKARQEKTLRDQRIDHTLDAIDSVMPIEGDVLSSRRAKSKLPTESQIQNVSQTETPQSVVGEKASQSESATAQTEQVANENLQKKGKLRLAKQQDINPWEEKPHKSVNLTPVDENKVAVGDVHVKDKDEVAPWGDNAQLGKIEHEEEKKPKRKYNRKPKQEPEKEQSATEQSEAVDSAQSDESAEDMKPVSELRINIGTKIEDTAGMGISFKSEDKVTPWGEGANLGKLEEEAQKPKRKYTRKPKNVEQVDEKKPETALNVAESVKEGENNGENATEAADAVENAQNALSKDDVAQEDKELQKEETADKSEEKAEEKSEKIDEKTAEIAEEIPVKKPRKPRKNKWDLSDTTLNQKYSTPSGKNKVFGKVDEDKVGVGGIHFKDGSDDPFGDVFSVASKAEHKDDEEN